MDVLFGDINPSARLVVTLPNVENEVQFTENQFPGVDLQADYTEKMYIGYRWYTANEVTPAFAFGHGLSYTTFQYEDLNIDHLDISLTVTNTGARAGSEVVQLYLQFPESADTPPLQLKGFEKTSILKAGESIRLNLTLRERDLSVYNADSHAWETVGALPALCFCLICMFLGERRV